MNKHGWEGELPLAFGKLLYSTITCLGQTRYLSAICFGNYLHPIQSPRHRTCSAHPMSGIVSSLAAVTAIAGEELSSHTAYVAMYRKESVHHPRPNNYRKDRKCQSAKARTIFHSYPAGEKCPTGTPCQLPTRIDTYKGAHCPSRSITFGWRVCRFSLRLRRSHN